MPVQMPRQPLTDWWKNEKRDRKTYNYNEKYKVFILLCRAACIYMGIIAVYPILYNFYLMFRNMSTRNFMNHQFVGLDTIKELLDKGVIWTAAYNTVLFTVVCTVIQFVIGFAFAMLLSRKFCMGKSFPKAFAGQLADSNDSDRDFI